MQMPDLAIGVIKRRLRYRRLALQYGGFAVLACVVSWSAVIAKEAGFAPPLAAVSIPSSSVITADSAPQWMFAVAPVMPTAAHAIETTLPTQPPVKDEEDAGIPDTGIRWFNGRPARPAREVWMTVTAYSPDARSCGDSADGITATLHDVSTNASRLVAADPRLLRYGSMLTIPGYDNGLIVPVLDCGGRIKGSRLDVLFPTHEQARAWGVRKLRITVWEYADGKPAEDPRRLR